MARLLFRCPSCHLQSYAAQSPHNQIGRVFTYPGLRLLDGFLENCMLQTCYEPIAIAVCNLILSVGAQQLGQQVLRGGLWRRSWVEIDQRSILSWGFRSSG